MLCIGFAPEWCELSCLLLEFEGASLPQGTGVTGAVAN
jgi:hypothetical protein